MEPAAPILVLDDGELLRVERLLKQLSLPFVRLCGAAIGRQVPAPDRLLIASGKRMLEPPQFVATPGAPEPIRVCIHGQDFLPLRERLRELGVHFLVQGALDQQSLGLLILQLLHEGPERRRERRLPLGGALHVRYDRAMLRVRLIELSGNACCLQAERRFAPGSELVVLLPASLGGGDELALPGRVTRCDADGDAHRVVVQLELGADARQQLAALTAGAQIGARVTPLLDVPARAATPARTPAPRERPTPRGATPADPETSDATERRRSRRVKREGRVLPLAGVDAPDDLVLTRDLSAGGACLMGLAGATVGQRLTLALFGAPREEPVVVEARVVRDDATGTAVAFESPGSAQVAQIERLCGAAPRIEAVDRATGATRPVHLARVTRLRVG